MLRGVSNIFEGLLNFIIIVVLITMVLPSILKYSLYFSNINDSDSLVKEGSIVYVSSAKNVKSGDIIGYKNDSSNDLCVVRVSEELADGMVHVDNSKVTKNVNVDNGNYIGKVVFSVPFIGQFINSLQNLAVATIFAVVLAIMIALAIFADVYELKDKDIELNTGWDVKVIEKAYRLYFKLYIKFKRMKKVLFRRIID